MLKSKPIQHNSKLKKLILHHPRQSNFSTTTTTTAPKKTRKPQTPKPTTNTSELAQTIDLDTKTTKKSTTAKKTTKKTTTASLPTTTPPPPAFTTTIVLSDTMKVIPQSDAHIAGTQRSTSAKLNKKKPTGDLMTNLDATKDPANEPIKRKTTRKTTTKKVVEGDSAASATEDNGDSSSDDKGGKKDTTALVRRRSTKSEIDHSVSKGHVNSKDLPGLDRLMRKMTKDDDHADKKPFDKQKEFSAEAKDKDNIVLVSWNLAGYRGAVKNGLWAKINSYDRKPDVVCLQEMKITQSVLDGLPADDYSAQMKKFNYSGVYNLGDKAGYSGVGVWYNADKLKLVSSRSDSGFAYPTDKKKPQGSVQAGGLAKFFAPPASISLPSPPPSSTTLPATELDPKLVEQIAEITGDEVNDEMRREVWNCVSEEGRITTLDFGSFYLITTYVPNSGENLDRLPYRHTIYEPVILEYLLLLQAQKPVMYCGDLNAAHEALDLHTPSTCQKSAGFQPEERERIARIIAPGTGFHDTYREFQGDNVHGYTYWSHRFGGRVKDRGWRIDYWLVSDVLNKHLKGAMVTDEFKPTGYGDGRISDHAPLWVSFDKAVVKQ